MTGRGGAGSCVTTAPQSAGWRDGPTKRVRGEGRTSIVEKDGGDGAKGKVSEEKSSVLSLSLSSTHSEWDGLKYDIYEGQESPSKGKLIFNVKTYSKESRSLDLVE